MSTLTSIIAHVEGQEPTEDTPALVECSHCQGSGYLSDGLNLDDVNALREELAATVRDTGNYGLHSNQRGFRIREASRVAWLATRIAWLEATDVIKTDRN